MHFLQDKGLFLSFLSLFLSLIDFLEWIAASKPGLKGRKFMIRPAGNDQNPAIKYTV